jgi:hypothetical protein
VHGEKHLMRRHDYGDVVFMVALKLEEVSITKRRWWRLHECRGEEVEARPPSE